MYHRFRLQNLARQGQPAFQWVDKARLRAKHWIFCDRNICSCSSVPKVVKTEMGAVGYGPPWAVAPLSLADDIYYILNCL
ncbi:hypothetical protein TNCV_2195011 [Trichonephila clavipes]|uniref:Uncharacterized protein n=1 Tax=Trichonephila clavipes TaxID=2585209 RepID=A0A8X6SGC0_TRICX|nr:hypothetical protein TNCV_2195011 [Trichonephila clavipes]